jgi:hypothetical protein
VPFESTENKNKKGKQEEDANSKTSIASIDRETSRQSLNYFYIIDFGRSERRRREKVFACLRLASSRFCFRLTIHTCAGALITIANIVSLRRHQAALANGLAWYLWLVLSINAKTARFVRPRQPFRSDSRRIADQTACFVFLSPSLCRLCLD